MKIFTPKDRLMVNQKLSFQVVFFGKSHAIHVAANQHISV